MFFCALPQPSSVEGASGRSWRTTTLTLFSRTRQAASLARLAPTDRSFLEKREGSEQCDEIYLKSSGRVCLILLSSFTMIRDVPVPDRWHFAKNLKDDEQVPNR